MREPKQEEIQKTRESAPKDARVFGEGLRYSLMTAATQMIHTYV